MTFRFFKYQGNGNDFIILDGKELADTLSSAQIRQLCDRQFGIGADGLILMRPTDKADFDMVYYNADGHEASMCGNGARCAAAYAFTAGLSGEASAFMAYDGLHHAVINKELAPGKLFDVSVSMTDVDRVDHEDNYYFLDTGSPHYVEFVERVAEIDVVGEGRKTRYSYRFAPDGTNVNFVELSGDRIFVRTYERGVEDETLSCGTGVTASAIAAYLESGIKELTIHTTGGEFSVSFEDHDGKFTSIWLRGPAEMVFTGEITI